METDGEGNVYVGFVGSVKKITPDGTISTFGPECTGCGYWSSYVGVGLDVATNIYVTTGNAVMRVFVGGDTLVAGGLEGYSDGPGTNAHFQSPKDAAVDSATNIAVADITAVRKVRPDGWVSTLAGSGLSGYKNGRGHEARFNNAFGLCADTNGNIYVVDADNSCIRKISPDTANIGIADDWQRVYFGAVGIDPKADPDHDGMSNFAEFWAGTNPLDANSSFAIDVSSLLSGGQIRIRWQSVAGKVYGVQYSTDLVTWNPLGSSIQGDGNPISVFDGDPVAQGQRRFYRVALTDF
jgi:hypothetical protein